MVQYNWMSHYAANMKQNDSAYPFRWYDVENETGAGKVISCTVFPGVQTVYNDLYMYHCGKVAPRNDGIIEISYCMDGRYECEVSKQYFFYVSHGDLSIGTVGRKESGGSFPTKRYSGLTVFWMWRYSGNSMALSCGSWKSTLSGFWGRLCSTPAAVICVDAPKSM